MHRAILVLVRRAALVAVALMPAALPAQIFKVGQRSQEPMLWASLSAGLFQSQSIIDGTTQTEWNPSDAVQYRGALEYGLRGGNGVGVAATHARVPLTYRYRTDAGSGDPCFPGCDATMTVNSLWGTFHGGGGEGLHYVVEGGLGYTWYRDFENDDTGAAIAGSETDKDFSFFIGTGFGYGLTRRFSINVVQDWAFARHQGEGLSNSESTTAQQRTTRIGVRYGVGSRRPGV